jgi:fatty acid synthase subunit alpha
MPRLYHSLLTLTREYSALASIADVVFYREITMQRAVERNSENYAMCAVNPSRVSFTGTFSVREVVDSIAARTAALLEIVNYDVVA